MYWQVVFRLMLMLVLLLKTQLVRMYMLKVFLLLFFSLGFVKFMESISFRGLILSLKNICMSVIKMEIMKPRTLRRP